MSVVTNETLSATPVEGYGACLHDAAHFGFIRVHDVCTDVYVDLPWGAVDWLCVVGIMVLFGAIILAVVAASVGYVIDKLIEHQERKDRKVRDKAIGM